LTEGNKQLGSRVER